MAGLLSGLPSTALALWRGQDPLAAARAAGALIGRDTLAAGVAVHGVLSVGWSAVVAAAVDRAGGRGPLGGAAVGAVAGAAIAALDLAVVGRRIPAIATLPQAPQWLDHLAFGALAGAAWAASSGPAVPPPDGSARRHVVLVDHPE